MLISRTDLFRLQYGFIGYRMAVLFTLMGNYHVRNIRGCRTPRRRRPLAPRAVRQSGRKGPGHAQPGDPAARVARRDRAGRSRGGHASARRKDAGDHGVGAGGIHDEMYSRLPGDGPAAGGGPSGIRCPGSRRRQRSGRFVLLHFACKRRTGRGHPERAARRAGSWRRFIEASGRPAGSPAFRLHRHGRDTRKSSAGHAGASGIGSGASCGARPADARPPTGIAGKRRRFALIAMPAPTQHADLPSPIEGGKRGQGTL
jgi:hypothetical protein